jgi:hypothetical protein
VPVFTHIFVICLTVRMAKKKETQESPDGVLASAAKTIGAAAGTIAAAVGVTAPKPKVPKLVKKNKTRLPRREKKAAAKKISKSA